MAGRAIAACVFAGVSVLAWSGSGRGQVNLPPPPPPPLSTNNPPPPPPPSSTSTGGGTAPRPKPRPVEQHTTTQPQQREEPPTYEADEAERKLTLRLNPLPLFLSRLSVDVEYLLAPHHALVASPHITLKDRDRGKLPSYAFGYTAAESSGVGTELGYHYWLAPRMEGLYLGPSLLVGLTNHPILNSYAYYGFAFDVGYQLVLANGFTVGGGGGLLLVGAGGGNNLHLTPRLLVGVGWSF